MTKRSYSCSFMIQHLTSIIHSEIIGSLWKVVTYLPYERKLRAYWEYFEFRRVWMSDICLLAGAVQKDPPLGKALWERWICKARIHTCGNQLLVNTVFQLPSAGGKAFCFVWKRFQLGSVPSPNTNVLIFLFWASNPWNLPKINQTSHQGTEIILLLISSFA